MRNEFEFVSPESLGISSAQVEKCIETLTEIRKNKVK